MTQNSGTDAGEQAGPGHATDYRALAGKSMRTAAVVVKFVTSLFAAILVIHAILVIGGANAANYVAVFFRDWASGLALGVNDLFLPASEALRVVLNSGLAAIIWIVIGMVISRILNALAP